MPGSAFASRSRIRHDNRALILSASDAFDLHDFTLHSFCWVSIATMFASDLSSQEEMPMNIEDKPLSRHMESGRALDFIYI